MSSTIAWLSVASSWTMVPVVGGGFAIVLITEPDVSVQKYKRTKWPRTLSVLVHSSTITTSWLTGKFSQPLLFFFFFQSPVRVNNN